ncbi:MAG TPA: flagellar basal-body MS-ring/collar protein FliF [Gammaproteobacteria bacterium]
MAEGLPQTVVKPLAAFTVLPVQRQIAVLGGIAMAIALAVSLALWGLSPSYQVLLPGLGERDIVDAMSVLDRNGIDHKLDSATGALMVPADKTHEARLHLATEGLPRETTVGFELLDRPTGLGGTSRLAEATRYQRALEGELARSIMTLDSVESARVHLALPRESVFVRERAKPSASVLLNLHPGRTLDDKRVAGIVHLVASSVPDLAPERVTVVDQRGRLLSGPGEDGALASMQRLEYTREIEEALRRRVHDILSPLVGEDRVRAQVTAEIDFTEVESTHEAYDPERTVLRSEQVSEEQQTGPGAAGIPGALTNQPPDGAVVAGADGAVAGTGAVVGGTSRSSTRNFEVDRRISHIRGTPGAIKRLSVAVVVDDRQTTNENGETVTVPRSDEEMAHLTALVREAVGFDAARGDSVNVVNASFRAIESPDAPLAEPPLWQEPWIQELARQAMAGVGLLLVILLVLRPAVRPLLRPQLVHAPAAALGPPPLAVVGDGADDTEVRDNEPRTLEGRLEQARLLTREDPRLVAQVVRRWMQDDEK